MAAVEPEMVLAQVRAVLADIGADAVKVGMLGTLETAQAVAAALAELPRGTPVVVDPVMVAESGARLLEPSAERFLAEQILPLATVVTPNLQEARVLAGAPQREEELPGEAEQLARAVLALGPGAVIVTGGHREAGADLLLTGPGRRSWRSPGSGTPGVPPTAPGAPTRRSSPPSSRSAAICPTAARIARARAGAAVAGGYGISGSGAGPVDAIGLARLRQT